jgi:carotenoid cleavage dioxygenase-like enzyme
MSFAREQSCRSGTGEDTLVNPLTSLYVIILNIFRTISLVILSRLPGSTYSIKKISVANTGILFHDGRALATCEAGPPMRMSLPGLETVGWYNGKKAEGEADGEEGPGFGGEGLIGFMKEWTTAHPRVDPRTEELILFHSTFVSPYVHYSIVPATYQPKQPTTPLERPSRLLNAPVPGITSAKMMHDFGVSMNHTVIMDLPLSLDPLNLAKNIPVVAYDPCAASRFGVFPRHRPDLVRWFETTACCVFHTANTWDDAYTNKLTGNTEFSAVNMLACRLTSASLVFSAGDITIPAVTKSTVLQEEEQCRLYYYQFDMTPSTGKNVIKYQFALAALPFEFPSNREDTSMAKQKYVYGCSTSTGSFTAALGRAVKIDCLVKIDSQTLIKRGIKDSNVEPVSGCVDTRSIDEIMASKDKEDPIKIFRMPQNCYAQEPRFVPRKDGKREDDGWLLTYVFDESQLDERGECKPDAKSELWIIDAVDMKTIVARVTLPSRVTYGLHGVFVDEKKILSQRPVETIRSLQPASEEKTSGLWPSIRRQLEDFVG